MELIDFVYFGDFNKRISNLAELSPEAWSFDNKNDNSILKNYLKYTFLKLQEENRIIQRDTYCIFNTGLFTEYYESVYAYMELNKAGGSQKWYLVDFYQEYDLGNIGINEFPDRANYFDDPSLLVFDAKCKINVQYKHIFEDKANLERIPNCIKDSTMLPVTFEGAISRMKKMIVANYKIAVPQYYNGKIQLLLPLSLVDCKKPDLALVVTKNKEGNFYQGRTCLSLDMAYNNARLIARPDSNWLIP